MQNFYGRSIRGVAATALLGLSVAGVGCVSAEDQGVVREISQQALLSNPPEDVLILDVRSLGEYTAGHVPNAVNIPHDELASRLSDLDSETDRPIVVYCKSGHRAGMAASLLQDAGYEDLHHLTGDMNGWMAKGLATE
ncbi:MAG: rhodanese-like domain-containing protein [Myxococcales bacterium]|nr:rhodanese-like domain-containing protein [Myxococcales bacterium]HIK86614.1 rhodanese-like domain-containing protein [Myxococcales bacterium]